MQQRLCDKVSDSEVVKHTESLEQKCDAKKMAALADLSFLSNMWLGEIEDW